MPLFRNAQIAAATVFVALTAVPFALAGGEPKNELPFTRVVSAPAAPVRAAGEAKNELPFTRPVTTVPPSLVVVQAPTGFRWVDAAIGAVAALGLVLVAVAATALARMSRSGKHATAV